jgi:hypothetical protein
VPCIDKILCADPGSPSRPGGCPPPAPTAQLVVYGAPDMVNVRGYPDARRRLPGTPFAAAIVGQRRTARPGLAELARPPPTRDHAQHVGGTILLRRVYVPMNIVTDRAPRQGGAADKVRASESRVPGYFGPSPRRRRRSGSETRTGWWGPRCAEFCLGTTQLEADVGTGTGFGHRPLGGRQLDSLRSRPIRSGGFRGQLPTRRSRSCTSVPAPRGFLGLCDDAPATDRRNRPCGAWRSPYGLPYHRWRPDALPPAEPVRAGLLNARWTVPAGEDVSTSSAPAPAIAVHAATPPPPRPLQYPTEPLRHRSRPPLWSAGGRRLEEGRFEYTPGPPTMCWHDGHLHRAETATQCGLPLVQRTYDMRETGKSEVGPSTSRAHRFRCTQG